MARLQSLHHLSPAKITTGYLAFGVLWIPSTDYLTVILVDSQRLLTQIQTLKGWVFVALSGLLIFGLTNVHDRQMGWIETKLRASNQQLRLLHRVFRHNIRNDLNVIRGYAELIHDAVEREEVRAQLEVIRRRANQIVTISEKLKVVDAIDSTPSEGRYVDLSELVSAERQHLLSEHPKVTITISDLDAPLVEGDESLSYAIREVLENAVQHHDKSDSEIEIEISLREDDTEAILTIVDNGPGIPQHEIMPLHTEEETSLNHASSIGLWLVSWLCQMHNGAVRFAPDPTNGTTVEFRFRAHPPALFAEHPR